MSIDLHIVTTQTVIQHSVSRVVRTVYQCKSSVEAISRCGPDRVRVWCEVARRFLAADDFEQVKYIMPCRSADLPDSIRRFFMEVNIFLETVPFRQ